jgi:peroxiredoxin Q/BCP
MTERTVPHSKQGSNQRPMSMWVALGVVAAVAVGGYWVMNQRGLSGNANAPVAAPQSSPAASATSPPSPPKDNQAGRFPYKVAKPGPGDIAPPIRLTTTRGAPFDLDSLRGQTVLLYFQEGLMCQACWEQLKAIEASFTRFRLLGITAMVTITTDPPDLLEQKVRSERYFMPVVADPSVAVSQAYHANDDGMMGKGTRYDAHTFIVVGPDGKILWRADYGGAPNYTMYIPVPNLIADIARGLKVDAQTETP